MPSTNKCVAIFFADGLEEIEGLTVVDLLFRACIPCDIVSISDALEVTSSHGVRIGCDRRITDADFDFDAYEMLVLPGGMPGTTNLGSCEELTAQLVRFAKEGKQVAAICAAPTVLAKLGLLEGRRATCYPDMQPTLVENGAELAQESVVLDGNITTSKGMGTAIDFGLALIARFQGQEAADDVAAKVVYKA